MRPPQARLTMLLQQLPVDQHRVFSGAATPSATPLEPFYHLIGFLHLDPMVRLARLRQREFQRHGARIQPGGDMTARHADFIDWAAAYDTAGPTRRSLVAHQAWLADQAAPVLRLNSSAPVQDLV